MLVDHLGFFQIMPLVLISEIPMAIGWGYLGYHLGSYPDRILGLFPLGYA
jgi:hypothetical protein